MAKTLADMTAEERADCVGMWCDNLVSTADNPKPVVLACVQGERCWILHTDLHGEWSCFSLGSVSPRFDLPRAWTPDGQPVDMNKEYGQCEMGGTPDGAPAIIVHVDDGRTEYASEDTPHGEVYRWVGEWEQDNE